MQGPLSINPSQLAAAKKAYNADLAANEPGLIDGDGISHAISPFVTDSDGGVSFNRWIDAENRLSAQNQFFDDTEVMPNGTEKTVRRPMWQAFTEYTNDEARDQFDYISMALKQLQGKGFNRMNKLYNKAIGKID